MAGLAVVVPQRPAMGASSSARASVSSSSPADSLRRADAARCRSSQARREAPRAARCRPRYNAEMQGQALARAWGTDVRDLRRRRPRRPPETDVVHAMMAELRHRGPDGEGIFAAPGVALGTAASRSSTSATAGIQPFASEDGTLQLAAQRRDLQLPRAARRARGARPPLPHRDRHRGRASRVRGVGRRCVERFNGMWALALWDGRRERLFCSRDRFGVKPFYYRSHDGRFVFASELEAFRATRPRRSARTPRRARLPRAGYIDHTRRDVLRRRPPAPARALAHLDADGLRVERYWRSSRATPPGDPVEALRELFLDSIRLRLRSDVPVGTCPLRRARLLRGRRSRSTTCCGPRRRTRGRSASGSGRSPRSSKTPASTSGRSRRRSSSRRAPSRTGSTFDADVSTKLPRSSRRRASRSARRASSRSGS